MERKIAEKSVDYPHALDEMEQRVNSIIAGEAEELLWLLEHPPLYTAGTSAQAADLVDESRFPTYNAGRGGEYTYHGPGQRVAYAILDLKKRHETPDLKRYVNDLEQWIINSLGRFGVNGERREGRVGIWVASHGSEAKIAAIGIRVRKWVSFHGIALNNTVNLEHYSGIIPCGIREHGVTSLEALGVNVSMEELDNVLVEEFQKIFG